MNANQASAGVAVVDVLLAQEVRQVFCVPGESYLAILDALYDAPSISVISTRHESGAAMMALANARLQHRAGVCLVTRGPGATNASIAVHIASQASIPLVLVVGQVPREHVGREAFQELDYQAYFGSLAKHVEQVDNPSEVSAAMSRAFAVAESGRPGPVVVALPEDVLVASTARVSVSRANFQPRLIESDQLAAIRATISQAKRPLIIAGGGQWTDQAGADLARFAELNQIPVCTSFRRHDLIDNSHPCFAGYLGYGTDAAVWEKIAEADCVVVIGARLDEPTTQAYSLFQQPRSAALIHIYPNKREIGLNYEATHGVVAEIPQVAAQLAACDRMLAHDSSSWCRALRALADQSAIPPQTNAALDPGEVMRELNRRLSDDAIVTVDAGNFSRWPQRYRAYRRPGRLLAPINGAMGFAVPAAVGAALTYPERQVVGCVGDGGMLMTGMELATAAQYGAAPLILVFNNSRYGTIEMHQDLRYPGRHVGTELMNPDFAAFAASFGHYGATVRHTSEIARRLDEAMKFPGAALLDLIIEGY